MEATLTGGLHPLRSCLDFTANKFKNELFGLFVALFGIFALSILANRPLFAANRVYKATQKALSTKLEIKSKQLLRVFQKPMIITSSVLLFNLLLKVSQILFLLRLLVEAVYHMHHGIARHHVVPCLLYALRVHRVADVRQLSQQVEAIGDEGEVPLQDTLR